MGKNLNIRKLTVKHTYKKAYAASFLLVSGTIQRATTARTTRCLLTAIRQQKSNDMLSPTRHWAVKYVTQRDGMVLYSQE